MSLKITPHDGHRRSDNRSWKELEIDNGAQSLTLTIWDDGTFDVEASDYEASEWEDDGAFSVPRDETPDVIMAITEFLGSL